jgi:hypothetical protein
MTRVCMRGLRRFTTKPSGYLVEPQNQDRRLGGRRRDPGAPRSFDAGGHVARSQGLHWEDADCGDGMAVRWRGVLYDLYAPEGFVSQLKCYGYLGLLPGPEGLIYINSRVSRQTILPDCFSLPCSIGFDFSPVCKESDLRVYGSFHGCVDFPFVARVIFVSFLSYFRWIFVCGLFLRFWGV